jgi:hypothetical protein
MPLQPNNTIYKKQLSQNKVGLKVTGGNYVDYSNQKNFNG